eukprot:Opistho-2@2859
MAAIPGIEIDDMNDQSNEGTDMDLFSWDGEAEGDGDTGLETSEDLLSTGEKIAKYARSEHVLQRLFIAKDLSEIARSMPFEECVAAILPVLGDLINDAEAVVRQTLCDQIPRLAIHFEREGGAIGHAHIVSTLAPHVLHLLEDLVEAVRGSAHEATLALFGQGILSDEEIENVFCPAILRLARNDAEDEHRMEAVSIISRASLILPPRVVQGQFVSEFCNLTDDQIFRVRKACASCIGAVGRAIGPEMSAQRLLPQYVRLAKDEIWGVRKACAESLAEMAASVTREVRSRDLVDLFKALSEDQSKWVKTSAFISLGPFYCNICDCR